MIPDTVRNLYNIPKDSFRDVSALSSIGVAEFEDAAHYSKSDLSAFDTATGTVDFDILKLILFFCYNCFF